MSFGRRWIFILSRLTAAGGPGGPQLVSWTSTCNHGLPVHLFSTQYDMGPSPSFVLGQRHINSKRLFCLRSLTPLPLCLRLPLISVMFSAGLSRFTSGLRDSVGCRDTSFRVGLVGRRLSSTTSWPGLGQIAGKFRDRVRCRHLLLSRHRGHRVFAAIASVFAGYTCQSTSSADRRIALKPLSAAIMTSNAAPALIVPPISRAD